MKAEDLITLRKEISEFFGFKVYPFSNTPDIDFLYESRSFLECYSALYYAISQRLGFCLITGEVGTGKTHLLRYFLKNAPIPMEYALILNPILNQSEMLEAIVEDLKIPIKVGSGSIKENIYAIYKFVLTRNSEGKRVVVVIDEAQDLPLETLEAIRLLSNLETDSEKLIDIVLAGQPELEVLLQRQELRQLNQRIWVRARVKPLDLDEVEPYLDVRFERSGAGKIFDRFIVGEVYNYTKGVPRLINALMERAILAAYVDESKIIRPRHIKRAVESLNGVEG